MAFSCEVLCVGNELLIGKTLNTNAHWLCGQLTSLGGTVRRVTVVPDHIDTVARAFGEALQRGPSVVVVTGGLGPTFDDRTLVGIAHSLNVPLVLDDGALCIVREAVNRQRGCLDPTTIELKQAHIPLGATALANHVGTAPAVRLKKGDTAVFVLPGVPAEMRAIFKQSIKPHIRRRLPTSAFRQHSIKIRGIPEALLAPLIDKFMQKHTNIYFKSHPSHRQGVEVHLSSIEDGVTEEGLKEVAEDLKRQASRLAPPLDGW